MDNSSGISELQAREREAEEAQARLANTLDRLTSPETHEAVKAEMLGRVQGYKNELLKQADAYKDELLQKAEEYKGEMLERADSYKGEIFERAEQYKSEFLSRAEEYKNEALERAETYKDEALQRGRDAARETLHNLAEDLKTRALKNPVAVALIGAGVGWRLYKHPPVTTLLVGAGAALLMRTPGRSARDALRSDRDTDRETQPAYGYPVAEGAQAASATEQLTAAANDFGERARSAAAKAGAEVSDVAERLGSTLASAAETTLDRAGGLAGTARQNPLMLGLLGLAAGAVLARSMRGTETGDRLIRGSTERIGGGARKVSGRVSETAHQAVDAVAGVTTSAASAVREMAETVRGHAPYVASGIRDAAGRASETIGELTSSRESDEGAVSSPASRGGTSRRQGQRSASQPGVGRRARREIMDMAEQYPLLLSTAGVLVGAVAGVALRPSIAEDRYVGPVSDALKQRARKTVSGRIEGVLTAADQVISAMDNHLNDQDHVRPPRGKA